MPVQDWERRTEIPLILLAVAFTVAYVWPVLDQELEPGLQSFFTTVSWTVWGAFGVDLAIRLYLADDRLGYAKAHWYDVALVLLPLLKPLRPLRLLALVRILDRSASGSLAGKVLVYITFVTTVAVFLGAVAALDAERDATDANITTFGDALWWSMTTVTTVGYGDRYPVTLEGRLVAVVLMVLGIGLVGSVIASVATWIMARAGHPSDTP
ncbi:MAG: potassium channel family protein [Actinomycetales bacterium]